VSLALYRRYRPETFAEVIGQDQVTRPLQQALRNDRVHHAYLFSGPHGCGKTTCARILARSLNCEQGPTPEPCGKCQSCRDLARDGAGSLDVIEIDAASHGGVDDARDLRERAFFGPAGSRYKVYIVDEAHMVTTQGFNALLKVVEEPPPHVKFIFATTEPEKVISTIRSRTHHYPFRLVPPGTLGAYLEHLCAEEGISVEPAVLPLVVQAGGGSVRDSLSVLDQLLAGADEHGVTYATATTLLGYTDAALIDAMVDAFAARDGAVVFEVIERVVDSGLDPRRFCADVLDRIRDLLLVDAVPEAVQKRLVLGSPEQLAALPAQAARFGRAELVRAAEILNAGLVEMRGATAPRLQLELICARVLLPGVSADEVGLAARLDRVERRLSIADAGRDAQPDRAAPEPGVEPRPEPRREPPPEPKPEQPPAPPRIEEVAARPSGGLDVVEMRRLWPSVLDRVRDLRKVTWMMLFEKVTVASVDDGKLLLAFRDAGSLKGFAASGHDAVVREALLALLGVDLAVEAVLDPSRPVTPAVTTPDEAPVTTSSRRAPRPQPAGPSVPAVPSGPSVPLGGAPPPEDDSIDPHSDPDTADSGLSPTDLLARELGAVVVEQVGDT
jgi:DNA polymerase-3 subunit gamma/tau